MKRNISGKSTTYNADRGSIKENVGKKIKTAVRNIKNETPYTEKVKKELKKHNLTEEEFNSLRLRAPETLTVEEVARVKAVRDTVPQITSRTWLRKTIPIDDVDSYLEGKNPRNTIRGFVAMDKDVAHIGEYEELRKALRLDYIMGNGIEPFSEGLNKYAYIKFKTADIDDIEIPYGKEFGGTAEVAPPCTLNGFTASTNGEVIPEWWVTSGKEISIKEGAELHMVIEGKDEIIARFGKKQFEKVRQQYVED